MSQPDKKLLGEAADWLIRLQASPQSAELTLSLAAWRQQSTAHEAAWQRAQQVQVLLAGGRQPLAQQLLKARKPVSRRQLVQAMLLLGAVPLTGWWLWRDQTHADYHTAIGEQQIFRLPDGGLLQLNTDSAVAREDTSRQRVLHVLRGEIALTTGSDPRPLYVQTPFGKLQPIGTRFAVRLDERSATVTVSAGEVLLTLPDGRQYHLPTGQSRRFDGHHQQIISQEAAHVMAWTQGQLRVDDWPLPRVLAELSRYRRGTVRCSDDVAARRVSGVFWLQDTDAALELLAHSHRLQHYRLGPWLSWFAKG